MAKEKSNYGLSLVAIVAIVAVVGLVMMFTNKGTPAYTTTATSELQNHAMISSEQETNTLGAAVTGDQMAIGSLDAATCEYFAGWALDPDRIGTPIAVHFYVDGQYLTYTVADKERADIKNIFGANAAFNKILTAAEKAKLSDGKTHTITAYAIGITSENTLSNSNPPIGTKTTEVCNPAVIPTLTCADTDKGTNYYLKGTVKYGDFSKTDVCSSTKQLTEYYCNSAILDNGYFALKTPSSEALLRYMSFNAGDQTVTFKDLTAGNDIVVSYSHGEFELIINGVSNQFAIVPVSTTRMDIKAAGTTRIIPYELYNCQYGCTNGACIKTPAYANETVTCVFMNSFNTTHYCYSSIANCTGYDSCNAFVWGLNATKVSWNSDCAGSPTTTIDGVKEKVYFNCTVPIARCTDTDGGKNFYLKGSITGAMPDGYPSEDKCVVPEGRLREVICENNYGTSYLYDCPNGCNDGACILLDKPAIGYLDVASCESLGGWALDPDLIGTPIAVHFYVDGQYLTYTVANLPRDDIKNIYGANAAFNKILTAAEKAKLSDGKTHTITAYAIGITSENTLSNSNPPIGTKTTAACTA